MAPHPADAAAAASALDFEREWHRAADEAGASRVLSRNVVRTLYTGGGGSGTTDTVRLGPDALVNVINCVMPRATRWDYVNDESLIMLRASLACAVEFRFGQAPPMVFDHPELTLGCIPRGLAMSAVIAPGDAPAEHRGGAARRPLRRAFRAAAGGPAARAAGNWTNAPASTASPRSRSTTGWPRWWPTRWTASCTVSCARCRSAPAAWPSWWPAR
ncbi:MAG: hypothetical protein U1F50_16940 [Rubrivivax sp.]